MQLNRRIRNRREELNLPQVEVAKVLGMGRLTYASIEAGDRPPTINELQILSEILQISIDDLLELNTSKEEINLVKYRQMCLSCIKAGGDISDGKITKTKLAKLLYLVDFTWFKSKRESMSGMQYYKLPLGPVAKPFFRMIDEMFDAGMITIEAKGPALMISINEQPSADGLSPEEVEHINFVCRKSKDRDTQAIVELTHNQAPWAQTDFNDPIPYELVDKIPENELL